MVRCTHIISINIRFRIALTTTNFPTSHVTLLWCTHSPSVLLPYGLSKVSLWSLPFTSKCIMRFNTPELVFVTFCSVNGMVSSPFGFGPFLTVHVLRPLWRIALPFCLPKPVDSWCRDDQTVPQYDPSSLAYRHQCQCLTCDTRWFLYT